MNLFLTIVATAVVSTLFFVPAIQALPQANYLQLAAVAILALSILVQIVALIRRTSSAKTAPPFRPRQAPPLQAPGAAEAEVEAEVVQLLARLQEKGRLVDFAMDDITPYSNEQVGAAARVVHQGCREVLQSFFDPEPVHPGEEQESVSLSEDYDANAYRLIGNVPENPPYNGTVLHRGWKTVRISLPRLTKEGKSSAAREIIAPAEVEVG
jgi:hypothetical protein